MPTLTLYAILSLFSMGFGAAYNRNRNTYMTLLEKLFAVSDVLQKGKALENPETWKNSTALMNIVGATLALIPQFTALPMDTSQQNAIAFGIVTAIGVFNSYVHIASSTKVGV